MGKRASYIYLLIGYLLGCDSRFCSVRADGPGHPIVAIIEENDAFVGRNEHYTQGLKLGYLAPENRLPDWLESLSAQVPTLGIKLDGTRAGFVLGQRIYTPSDTKSEKLVPDDRPYAGLLYAGFAWQRWGNITETLFAGDSLQLAGGVTGPPSLGEGGQNWFHSLIGSRKANGWDNQLKTEPVFDLTAERNWVWTILDPADRFSLDLLPGAGLALGTVQTYFSGAGYVRLGYNIPHSFLPRLAEKPLAVQGQNAVPGPGFYIFGGAEGRAVARDMLLDGNLFRDSHHVDREWFVADFEFGLGIMFHEWEADFTCVIRTDEFTAQRGYDRFASIQLKMHF